MKTTLDDSVSLRGLLRSLGRGSIEAIRNNRLAACLSAIALVVSTTLAVTSHFDERPRYRAWILPEIERAEEQFFAAMNAADTTRNEAWRLHYFIAAHGKAKDVIRIAKSSIPTTATGRKAHGELIRYYSLVNEELAIIRTEMSLYESIDYVAEWKRQNAGLSPIRERWLSWVNGTATAGR